VVPEQVAPMLLFVSQTLAHAPQVSGDDSDVSQPFVSGGVVLQSAQPGAQPVYVHVVPEQVCPRLCTVSQPPPHTAQVDPVTCVSQPFVSGGVVSQSAHPGAHPAYVHVVPVQIAPVVCVVVHMAPHAPQLSTVSVGPHPTGASTPVSAVAASPSVSSFVELESAAGSGTVASKGAASSPGARGAASSDALP
jgi:hypothetical protein